MTHTEHWINAPKGGVKTLLRELLALADDPHHVAYPGYGDEVTVPAYLAKRWTDAHTPTPKPKPAPAPKPAANDSPSTPARRRNKDK